MDEKKLTEVIEVPEGISVLADGNKVMMKKGSDEISKELNPLINIKAEGGKIILSSDRNRRKEKKLFGATRSHLNNMIIGLTDGFKYTLQVANVHFPMTVSYDKNKNEIIVKNFLGEKKDRRIKLVDGVDVKINKDIIEVESKSIEKAGQAAANIEKGTKVRNRDRRIFQDGIFITEKPGRAFV
jgi:large subunit ribosomal protein L6